MGLSLFTGCVSEVAFFLYAEAILKRFGLLTVFNGCVLLMGIRMLALSLLALPYQVLFVEVLAGPIFALGWTAGITFSRQLVPAELGATMVMSKTS